MFSNTLRTISILILIFGMASCVSLAVDAPFVADKANRKQFVESIAIGKTNVSELTSRWGNVTSAGTANAANDQYYNWVTGFNPNGSSITITTSESGVVKSVQSAGPAGPDNFRPKGNAIQTSQQAKPKTNSPSTSSAEPVVTSRKQSGRIRPEDLTKALINEMWAYADSGVTISQFINKYGEPSDRSSYQRLFVQTVTTLWYGNDQGGDVRIGPQNNWFKLEFTDDRFSGINGALNTGPGTFDYY